MKVKFVDEGWEEYCEWQKSDPKMVRKINALLEEISRTPFGGTGKPEPLKYALAGCWSRRLTQEHRLVYDVVDGVITVYQCRYHY
jgi:toxin YoeB